VNPRVFFGRLPDPLCQYRVLKSNESYSRYETRVLPAFNARGHRVLPALYRTVIPEAPQIPDSLTVTASSDENVQS
jgi:hypothetical protein